MKGAEFLRLAGVVLAAIALFLPSALSGLPSDVALLGAQRVLAGEVPYRDFWTMYAPGQFYLLASLFALFGTNALVSSLAGMLLSALAVGLAYLLAARITERWSHGLASAALFAAAFIATGYYGGISSYAPAMLCILAAFNLLERFFEHGGRGSLIGAGLAIGSAALFKHDVAGYTALAMLCGLAVFRFLSGETAARRGALRDPLIFAMAAAVPVLPAVAALALFAGYDAFWDTIWFPATIFSDVRGENYPSLLPTGLYNPWKVQLLLNWSRYAYFALPFLIWLASMAAIAIAARRGQAKLAALGVALSIVFLFHYLAAHVQINTHIITMTLYATFLGTLSLKVLAARREGAGPITARGTLAAAIAGGWLVVLAAQPVFAIVDGRRPVMASLGLSKVSSVKFRPELAKSLSALAEYVQRRVAPGQPIYVGLRRHDILITSRPFLYFLIDRPPATRFHELHGGVADTAPVQVEIIRDLKNKDVRLLILASLFNDDQLDRMKRSIRSKQPQIGALGLDAFIRANYAPSKRFGEYVVWLKNTVNK